MIRLRRQIGPRRVVRSLTPLGLGALAVVFAASCKGSFFAVQNEAPQITSLVPASAVAGDTSFTLRVLGTGFMTTSTVNWNGSPLQTTYVSASEVDAAIGALDIAVAGRISVTVSTPAPGGGTSASTAFTVQNKAPQIRSLVPAAVFSGDTSFTLRVLGTGFTSTSTVNWNGSPLQTTHASASELDAAIGAADIGASGKDSVTVSTPPPGGGTSSTAAFIVIPYPVPAPASWDGSVTSTPAVTFGGSGYCTYSGQFDSVAMHLSLNGQSYLSGKYVETALNNCPYSSSGPYIDTFQASAATVAGDQVDVQFSQASGQLGADATFSGTLSADSSTISGTITIHRTDEPSAPSLEWTMNANMSLPEVFVANLRTVSAIANSCNNSVPSGDPGGTLYTYAFDLNGGLGVFQVEPFVQQGSTYVQGHYHVTVGYTFSPSGTHGLVNSTLSPSGIRTLQFPTCYYYGGAGSVTTNVTLTDPWGATTNVLTTTNVRPVGASSFPGLVAGRVVEMPALTPAGGEHQSRARRPGANPK